MLVDLLTLVATFLRQQPLAGGVVAAITVLLPIAIREELKR
jgi:hypothetical protein